ncbi:alginate O-acetyltransferase AlgX-related protein [Deinococcus alpinitundrae]|uniref:alginate O-acetyltransferase AlgX-related protein n=1 Tax=Deinococcus alpinitundrae TaxID=468913 RepID=UPI00137A25C2|nr:hypothetical protein [Deinococcus alpinitundrae]
MKRFLLAFAAATMGSALAYCETPLTAQSGTYKATDLVIGEGDWVFQNQPSLQDFRMDYSITPDSLKALASISAGLKKGGTQLVMVLPPTKGLLEWQHLAVNAPILERFKPETALKSYEATIAALNGAGILAPNLYTAMKQDASDPFLRQDPHWSPSGAAKAAEAVAALIKAQPDFQLPQDPAFQPIQRSDITVKTGVATPFKSLTVAAVQAICGESPLQSFAPVSSEAGGLLGDPEITVVGTSFSGNPIFPFVPHLSELLGVDVGNAALSSGGYQNSILQYLEYARKQAPVKYLIWEMPGWYGYNNIPIHRQVLPAVRGGCETKGAEVGDALPIAPRARQYLYLKFPGETVEVNLAVDLGGKTEQTKLTRLPGLGAQEYFWQLDANTTSVSVTTPNNKPFQYGLCPL